MKYYFIPLFVIWLILGTGLAVAGTLTVSLEPSLDGDGIIKATSITKAVLSSADGALPGSLPDSYFINGAHGGLYAAKGKFDNAYINATIINGTAQFNLSDRDTRSGIFSNGASVVRINDLNDDLIPTRIDDPTKDIHQYVGEKLRVSVIGNISDPTYRIETFSKGQGKNPVVRCSSGTFSLFDSIYVILSLKTSPQKLEIYRLTDWQEQFHEGSDFSGNMTIIGEVRVTSFTPTATTHPSTSTSINPNFSKWVFGKGSHGDDYGGNDSKCSNCHGNLDTKPGSLSEINNGFCFGCHNGKGGTDDGFMGLPGQYNECTPKAPGFEALSVIAALMVVFLIKRK